MGFRVSMIRKKLSLVTNLVLLLGKDKQEWMENVASACESGWDFSSRWSGGKSKKKISLTILT